MSLNRRRVCWQTALACHLIYADSDALNAACVYNVVPHFYGLQHVAASYLQVACEVA